MRPSCLNARRRWLKAQDSSPGPIAGFLLRFHLARCAECRSFADGAASIGLLLADPVFPEPGTRVAQALSIEAARRSSELRDRRMAARSRRVVFRRCAFGSLAGAAAGVLVFLARPTLRQDPIDMIQSRAESIRQEIDLGTPAYGIGSVNPTIMSEVDDLEMRLRCLKARVESIELDLLEGGDPCEDT